MAKIIVDGKQYQVPDGNNLLHTCLSLGLNLPYFCWHPCLGSVGACRQCAVKQYQNDGDERGRIVMACMTPAADGTRISLEDPQAKDFRAGIIELLMTNHPHDCPVCEEGGECHLQDMTEMSGHTFRSYAQTKRTHRNQYLGPFINHEMNRCIACYRCVRYYQDYAGGDDLQMLGAHHHVYFGRHCNGTLESPFSGNLVEVCPTGVFTDKTFSQDYTRKWDLQSAPSVCQHCALGCNTSPGERYGRLKRIVNRYHSDINGYFLCDRGRFGYGFVNAEQRPRQVVQRAGDNSGQQAQIAAQSAATEAVSTLLQQSDAMAIGSPRASLENNFALLHSIGPQRFCPGLSDAEQTLLETAAAIYRQPDIGIPSPADIERADAIIILGEDIINTAPVLALKVRQAVRNLAKALAGGAGIPDWQDAAVQELAQQRRNPLIQLTFGATALNPIAAVNRSRAPEDIARLGFAIAHGLDSEAPPVSDLTAADSELVAQICALLKAAQRPLIISGSSLLSAAVLQAAANIAKALSRKLDAPCPLHQCLPECNSLGAVLLQEPGSSPPLERVLEGIESGAVRRLLVVENDLYRRLDSERLERALDKLEQLLVIDHQWTPTAAKADWVLPAASFAEAEGTLINSEGRAQRFFSVFPASADIRPAWQWLDSGAWDNIDALTRACAASRAPLATIVEAAPPAAFRRPGRQVPRMPHRYSGRTAIRANIQVSEPRQTPDPMSALGFTMEGDATGLPPALRPASWAPGWNSNQSIHKFQQEINGPLVGGPSGVRLLDDQFNIAEATWFSAIPTAFRPTGSALQPVPLYHIFGSEELSQLAAPIRARQADDYIALHPDDAAALQIGAADGVNFRAGGREFCVAVRLRADIPAGTVGLPMGLGGICAATLSQPLALSRAFDWQPPLGAGNANVFASDSGAAL